MRKPTQIVPSKPENNNNLVKLRFFNIQSRIGRSFGERTFEISCLFIHIKLQKKKLILQIGPYEKFSFKCCSSKIFQNFKRMVVVAKHVDLMNKKYHLLANDINTKQ